MYAGLNKILTAENLLFLLKFAIVSLGLAGVSLLLGLVIGVIFASFKISQSKILRIIANIYIELVRGTPMLLQIMIIFTVIPMFISRIVGFVVRPDYYLIGIIAMSMNSGAYQAEYIRGGINGVDKGQWEASAALGLSRWQMMKFVILPQAFKLIVPTVVSEFVTLIKDSSLISTIGASELLFAASQLGNENYDYMSAYTLAAVFYLIMTLTISYLDKKLERKLASSD
ncbi:His/Glu/Gln/Arg/opine family amino ABC transporter, permease, 3-TM region [Eggerthia catenaformis OT 569 = DSM 20559]|uniref:His/Glu/Gln/Arg/opine family amino ABC transporter, permease, 3-TM region n=1 Tax=Eggerthia catenaformis OT 569 = DSM 20559 TaxID=999415 RepID=M2PMR9_9FIRM|nr:amino acid ABC transporter permease [Eggerthia catenaformis]EMD16864.1 His/Glu/Gln/Arg/opine family amino ABC transporter, permease, 3-TM region [Eggerthia catenaformis OT 569 = DSM 20559]